MKHQLKFPASRLVILTLACPTLLLASWAIVSMALNGRLSLINTEKPVSSSQNQQGTLAMTASVSALGHIEPEGEIITLSAARSLEGMPRVEKILVQMGEKVYSGQILAILDNINRLQSNLKQAQAQIQVAEARLRLVQAGTKIETLQAQNTRFQRTSAEIQGQITQQNAVIEGLKARSQEEVKAQNATIERLQAEFENTKSECGRYSSLYESGAISLQEKERTCLQQETALKRLEEARANLNLIIRTSRSRIMEAEANLERTVVTLHKQMKEDYSLWKALGVIRPEDVQVARSELAVARASFDKARSELDLAYVRAPRDGQILKINTQVGELVGDLGIFELGQTEQMYVKAEVYETDIHRVRIGQRATIQTAGINDNLQGVVDEIGLQIGRKDVLGTDPVAEVDARVVEVRIRLDNRDSNRVSRVSNQQVNVIINTKM